MILDKQNEAETKQGARSLISLDVVNSAIGGLGMKTNVRKPKGNKSLL